MSRPTQTGATRLRERKITPLKLCALATAGEITPTAAMRKLQCTCGKEFYYYPSMRPSAKYCSHKCSGAHRKKGIRRTTDSALSSMNFRRAVQDRQGRFVPCLICGWDEAVTDVCHITAVKDGGVNAEDNVVRLCPNHHRLFDCGKVSKETIISLRDKRAEFAR